MFTSAPFNLLGVCLPVVFLIAFVIPPNTDEPEELTPLPAVVSETVMQEQEPERHDETRMYMQAKLANSQTVLKGLVTENFTLIASGAKEMKKISEASHWPTTIDEVYQHYSVAFRRQCDKLAEQAERNDLQAAHYTYLHMSTTCIDCHDYVRRRFTVKRQKKGGPVQLIPTQWDGPTRKKKTPGPAGKTDLDG